MLLSLVAEAAKESFHVCRETLQFSKATILLIFELIKSRLISVRKVGPYREKKNRKLKKVSLNPRVNPLEFIDATQININVSGDKFRINESCLKQFPNTLLGSSEKDYFWDEDEKEYFFDRDPHIFKYIHKYYRSGILHFSEDDCFEAFLDEMKFFKISTDQISVCCQEDYLRQMGRKQVKESDSKEPPEASSYRARIWEFCEEPQSSLYAKVFYYISCLIIFISITLNTVETIDCSNEIENDVESKKCGDIHQNTFFVLESVCVLFFTMEYSIRLYSTPRRWIHFKSAMSIIDIMAVIPYYVDLVMNAATEGKKEISGMNILITLRTLRIFRIFKLVRHSTRLQELSAAIARSTNELSFIVFMYTIVVILFASILFYAERVDVNSPFFNIPEAMWYTVVTTTTLGYGDVVPCTIQGKLIGSMCCLMGVMVIALPVPIIQMKAASAQ